jgi:uncharacterized membrane protein YuzA (DUF378 family)
MRSLKYIACAGLLTLATQGVSAATLGLVEFENFVNTKSPFVADLGGVQDVTPPGAIEDAIVSTNEFNGAATLPDGLPLNYTVHLNRTFIGDRDVNKNFIATTADPIEDTFLFKLDDSTKLNPATNGARIEFDASLGTGVNTGIENVVFSLFEADAVGNPGDLIATRNGAGAFTAKVPLNMDYLIRVMGNLRADVAGTVGISEETNFGVYDIVAGIFGVVVPLPPAILLFLTGIAALFGFSRIRGSEKSGAATA